MQSESIENVFARSWSLLSKNWIIIVPGLIVGVVAGIIDAFFTPSASELTATVNGGDVSAAVASAGPHLLRAAVTTAVGIIAFLITQTFTTGMAGAAWERGVTSLADGSASFREDAGRLLAAMVLLAVIMVVVGVLTLGIGWFVVLFFAIYMVPAVVLDNRAAVGALKLSAAIALKRAGPTIIIILLLAVISFVVNLFALPLIIVPFVGPIVIMLVDQVVTAYATMVIVGEYLNVHRSPDIVAAGPSA